MNLLKNITSKISATHLIYLCFILIHLFLFNINEAEWGDSYRILRAAEEIRDGRYPEDEKRPPLFSAILALRPNSIDPVIWGRIYMFFISFICLILFSLLVRKFIVFKKYQNVALLLFILNPVYLYWSIRIMSDVFFSMFVLISFYLYFSWRESLDIKKALVLGLITSMSVLVRFEGYLLLLSVGFGCMIYSLSDITNGVFKVLKKRYRVFIAYTLGAILILTPYLIYKNPFTSSYFEEPAGRTYDIKMMLIFLFSLIFLFGFTHAFAFFLFTANKIVSFMKENISLTVFILLELILILLWPAAVPRLFVPILPLMIIPLTISVSDFEERRFSMNFIEKFLVLSMPFLYIVAQYYLGLQFLVMTRKYILLIFLIQFSLTALIYAKKFDLYKWFLVLSMATWAFLVIYMHKDIFISVKKAAEYSIENLQGNFAYNDVSSVSNWYLNYMGAPKTSGKYYSLDSGEKITKSLLTENNLDYLIVTNEHNLGLEIDFDKRDYLKVIKEFRYNVNGSNFVTYVVQVRKDQL